MSGKFLFPIIVKTGGSNEKFEGLEQGVKRPFPPKPQRRHIPVDCQCFVRGSNNRLKCLPYENGRWGSWEDWGGEIASDPAAASLINDDRTGTRIRVFALGSDDALWERTGIV